MRHAPLTAGLALLAAASFLHAGDRAESKKKRVLKDTDVAREWVYDDLDAALKVARKESKPLFLVFR
ncbi:MAG: hypothetical protein ACYTEZ_04850 [Planctomycetota bacterium]|jgi:hypothetical protein